MSFDMPTAEKLKFSNVNVGLVLLGTPRNVKYVTIEL
jgi:hypothetical protein